MALIVVASVVGGEHAVIRVPRYVMLRAGTTG